MYRCGHWACTFTFTLFFSRSRFYVWGYFRVPAAYENWKIYFFSTHPPFVLLPTTITHIHIVNLPSFSFFACCCCFLFFFWVKRANVPECTSENENLCTYPHICICVSFTLPCVSRETNERVAGFDDVLFPLLLYFSFFFFLLFFFFLIRKT